MSNIESFLESLEQENDPEVLRTGIKILSYRLANVMNAVVETHEKMLSNAASAAEIEAIDKFYNGIKEREQAGVQSLMVKVLLGYLTGGVDNGTTG